MTLVVVLIPVLGRPDRLTELLASLERGRATVETAPLFLVTGDDTAEIAALRELEIFYSVAEPTRRPGSYARKINHGALIARDLEADWVFLAADDLCFCPAWADNAVRAGERHGKAWVGTNDDANPVVRHGLHATHSLVRVDYLERGTWDEPGKLLHEGYDHQFVDTEAVLTARQRDEWVFARDSVVEHLHPFYRGVESDATYELGQRMSLPDARLYERRRRRFAAGVAA